MIMDQSYPVSALGGILLVSQELHQRVASLCVLLDTEPGPIDPARESEVRQRWGDDMESRSAVLFALLEQR